MGNGKSDPPAGYCKCFGKTINHNQVFEIVEAQCTGKFTRINKVMINLIGHNHGVDFFCLGQYAFKPILTQSRPSWIGGRIYHNQAGGRIHTAGNFISINLPLGISLFEGVIFDGRALAIHNRYQHTPAGIRQQHFVALGNQHARGQINGFHPPHG